MTSPWHHQIAKREPKAAVGMPQFHFPALEILTQSLELPVQPLATGMQHALSRPPQVKVGRVSLQAAAIRVAALAIPRVQVRTSGFRFASAGHLPGPGVPAVPSSTSPRESGSSPNASMPPSPTGNGNSAARIRPPADIIKLEDRLFYLLQPPVETWLSRESLAFPMRPFPYQMEGVAFLYPRHAAILADEMGLGKTMQAITAIRLLLHAGEIKSVLLVCPKPLVSNWQREFEQWAPEIPLSVIGGDQHRRRWQWSLPLAVKLANYELLQRDRDLLEGDLRFDLVVLDEAQRIKNARSTTAEISRGIQRSRSWALTGTPVENSVADLAGIFEFLSPGYLSPDMKPHRMAELAGDYVLRRTKDKVLKDIPPKLFRDVEMELSPQQRETYRKAEDEGQLRLSQMGESVTIQHVFELVLRLKQICNFDPATGESCKLEQLLADLEEVAVSGRKAIVFSQWVSTLKRLRQKLASLSPLEYHGQVPSNQRDGILRRFRDDKSCQLLLISYGAGGVGLNLQFANYVFLFDRWWNPAVEDQAINRAHRIGACGPVTVCRYLTENTIEQRIDEILQEKRSLFEAIFSGQATQSPRNSTQNSLGLTQQEIFSLFKLKMPDAPIRRKKSG